MHIFLVLPNTIFCNTSKGSLKCIKPQKNLYGFTRFRLMSYDDRSETVVRINQLKSAVAGSILAHNNSMHSL